MLAIYKCHVATIPTGSAILTSPHKMVIAPITLPSGVIGTTSRYPIVPSVTIDYHMASEMVPNLSGCASRSAKWTNVALIRVAPEAFIRPTDFTSTRQSIKHLYNMCSIGEQHVLLAGTVGCYGVFSMGGQTELQRTLAAPNRNIVRAKTVGSASHCPRPERTVSPISKWSRIASRERSRRGHVCYSTQLCSTRGSWLREARFGRRCLESIPLRSARAHSTALTWNLPPFHASCHPGKVFRVRQACGRPARTRSSE
jgi:hypothetical protein